jgi:phenylalanyl-tRNA synthetase beta chain
VGPAAVGIVGQLLPALAEARGLSGADDIYVAELDLDAIARLVPSGDAQVEALPRFPSIVRDISIVLDERVRADRVRGTIRGAAPSTLASVREFDRYKGKGIPEGRYSLSIRLTFRSPGRTLTDADAQEAMGLIMEALAREHGAVQR